MCTVIIICAMLHAVYTKNTNNIVILLKESNYRNVKSTNHYERRMHTSMSRPFIIREYAANAHQVAM